MLFSIFTIQAVRLPIRYEGSNMRWLAVVVLLNCVPTTGVGAALDANELLALMAANDSQLDNVTIDYRYRRSREPKRRHHVPLEVDYGTTGLDQTTAPEGQVIELWLTRVLSKPTQPTSLLARGITKEGLLVNTQASISKRICYSQ